jgi:hypothetical protein
MRLDGEVHARKAHFAGGFGDFVGAPQPLEVAGVDGKLQLAAGCSCSLANQSVAGQLNGKCGRQAGLKEFASVHVSSLS